MKKLCARIVPGQRGGEMFSEPTNSVVWWILEMVAKLLPSVAFGWFVWLATHSFWWVIVTAMAFRKLEQILEQLNELQEKRWP